MTLCIYIYICIYIIYKYDSIYIYVCVLLLRATPQQWNTQEDSPTELRSRSWRLSRRFRGPTGSAGLLHGAPQCQILALWKNWATQFGTPKSHGKIHHFPMKKSKELGIPFINLQKHTQIWGLDQGTWELHQPKCFGLFLGALWTRQILVPSCRGRIHIHTGKVPKARLICWFENLKHHFLRPERTKSQPDQARDSQLHDTSCHRRSIESWHLSWGGISWQNSPTPQYLKVYELPNGKIGNIMKYIADRKMEE